MAIFYLENKPHAKSRTGDHIATQNHFDYICREGRYETIGRRHEELAYTRSGNMPDWANTPKDFWTQAEKHRRANGRAYREVKLGLQEELSLTENIQLVEQFCQKFGISTNHAFTYAIHDKPAAFDPNHRNIHAHIMFCEKIIDPTRPLDASVYFSQYRENREGIPTSGYLNDAYFKTRDCTVDMRKAWAKLVNEKFEEKGMDIRISEKTLKAQCEELKEQGKNEEAEYFDRVPAPHLGKAYRNPKKMEKIRMITEEVDTDSNVSSDDVPNEEEEQEVNEKRMEEASIEERKMLIFATDALIRRVAKELQAERQKQREEEREAAAAEKAERETVVSPMVVTVSDVVAAMRNKAEALDKEIRYLDGLYKETQKGILKDAMLWNKAKEKVVPGWRAAKVEVEKKRFALGNLKQKAYDSALTPADRNYWMMRYKDAAMDYNMAQTALDSIEREAENKRPQIEELFSESRTARAGLIRKSKDLYRRKMASVKEFRLYDHKVKEICDNLPMDKILYSEPLPELVDKTLLVDGYRSLSRVPKLTSKEGTFFILDDMRMMDKDSDFIYLATAIRDGDDVVQGKTKAYTLRIQYQDSKTKDGHPIRKPVILSVTPTEKLIRFYKVENTKSSGSGGVMNTKQANTTRGRDGLLGEIAGKLAEANKAAPKNKFVSLEDRDDKKDLPKTEYEQVEKELEQFGRSLSLNRQRFI